jgi:hypothetical protein
MVELIVIVGGREQMGREALSAVLSGDDAKAEELLRIMRPLNPPLAVIPGEGEQELTPGLTKTDQLSPDQT